MKKFFKYLLLTLLLILGIIIIGILYLFFNPKASLFGLTAINTDKTAESSAYNKTNISSIVLNSYTYDVVVETTSLNDVKLKVFSSPFGLTTTKNKELKITESCENGLLTFDVAEPHGLAFLNNSKVTLTIPKSLTCNLTIKNHNSHVTLNTEANINNLSYSTDSGTFEISKAKIDGKIDLKIGSGKAIFNENVTTNNNNMTVKISTGKLEAKKLNFGNIEIKQNERAQIDIKSCSLFTHKLSTVGGKIVLDSVDTVEISSSDTIVEINKILTQAIIKNSQSGSVKIGEANGAIDIQTNKGNINISNSSTNLLLTSKSGDINVLNATKKINASSSNGNIKITFKQDTPHYNSTDEYRFATVTNQSGNITVVGCEHIISNNNSGSTTIKLNDVVGENSINATQGSCYVVVNKDSNYILSTQAKMARVNLTQIAEYNGYTTNTLTVTYVNCTASSPSQNILQAKTTDGNLTLLDSNFASLT